MSQLNISLAVIGAVVIFVGLLSNRIKKSLFQEPAIAVLAGVAAGPFGLGWPDVAMWGEQNIIRTGGAGHPRHRPHGGGAAA